jgi:signal transduction histidine kinase
MRNVRDIEQSVAAARDRFENGERILSTVRTNVMLVSIGLRDALINQTPAAKDTYLKMVAERRAEVDRALPAYRDLVSTPIEKEQWARLQNDLNQYWQIRATIFDVRLPTEPGEAQALLSKLNTGTPSRDSILTIVNTLSELQEGAEARQRAEAAASYAEAQQRIITLAAVAMSIGLIVALAAARHVGRLERQIGRQRQAERQTRGELERLSSRLVTAQEEERRSLARELHDAVGQALTAIKMEMGVALRGVEADSRARTALEQARAIAESTLQSVRDLSQLLHPSMLDDFGVPEAVGAHLRSFSKRTGIRAQLTQERMDDRLPPEIEICVYRIVQEALTNVARHSGATSCTVSLVRRDDVLLLTIEDDGRGIDMSIARTPDARRGLGLIGMRERAQALAGTFVIENRPEGGMRVVVRIPVPIVEQSSDTQQQLAG